jgi:hypothetical protein
MTERTGTSGPLASYPLVVENIVSPHDLVADDFARSNKMLLGTATYSINVPLFEPGEIPIGARIMVMNPALGGGYNLQPGANNIGSTSFSTGLNTLVYVAENTWAMG